MITNNSSRIFTLGFSPCPNDTFIFDALVHRKIDTEGLVFEVVMADVEELNQKAFRNELDITKLSYHAVGHLLENYILLNAGSALGVNCGPLLIQNSDGKIKKEEDLINATIAIPGKNTTANLLLSLAYPLAQNKIEVLFSEIEGMVLSGEVDAGLIIHENRFTYRDKGLLKIKDLGEFWEEVSHAPIPLGGIAIKRELPSEVIQKVDRVLRRSVAFAIANPNSSSNYVKCHAQEMDEQVMKNHIQLYVNDYSIDLGRKGRGAVKLLFEKASHHNFIQLNNYQLFVD